MENFAIIETLFDLKVMIDIYFRPTVGDRAVLVGFLRHPSTMVTTKGQMYIQDIYDGCRIEIEKSNASGSYIITGYDSLDMIFNLEQFVAGEPKRLDSGAPFKSTVLSTMRFPLLKGDPRGLFLDSTIS